MAPMEKNDDAMRPVPSMAPMEDGGAAPMPAPGAADKRAPEPAPKLSSPSTPNQDKENAPNDFMVRIAQNTRHWAHPLRKGFSPAQRIDLTETVLFSSSNRVNSGIFKGSLRLSDLITKFRITVNAIDSTGVLGYK